MVPETEISVLSEDSADPKKIDLVPSIRNDGLYDVLCSHIIFNKTLLKPFFPDDTVYIAILREPFSQFKSGFVYYVDAWKQAELMEIVKEFPDDPINGFLSDFRKFSLSPTITKINNRMSVDLGFPLDDFEKSKRNVTKINNFIKDVESKFHLVLISDMFDESLVLLRRLMNWTTKEIIYFYRNKKDRHLLPKWSKNKILDKTLESYKRFAPIDTALYDL